ncbi:hypothetical protein DU500_06470 [Haloplanus rubicundus]|uniref:Uncharacterized protein n=1 Tax=Haloplanus rubicundus TaxID=1547898 RepID=A0A345EB89_9EURY|nr:hypothetical protein [Haloplanus rubicundus]AXG06116.1 hypothetical protein DU500_06470 [Haloplanus rubicundus]AXG09461.1 hypothetical protein DU484_06010 [Haloplanus rubicundus]
MSALRAALHAALNGSRLLAVAAAVALGEVALRIGLALHGPPALALLCPPVIAVVGFGLAASTVRAALPPDARPADGDAPALSTLVVAAVVGHAAALFLGTAGFLLLDTPIRAALYALGYGDALGTTAQVGGAVLGVVVGTLLAWAVPGIAVGRLLAGATPRRAVRTALFAPTRSPRAVAGALGLHVAFALLLGLSLAVGLEAGRLRRSAVVAAALGGGVALPILILGPAVLAARYRAWTAPRVRGPDRRRLALAALLCTGLVVGAAGVRTAELRPVDSAPDALPADPDAAYATALGNTFRADHRYRLAILDGDDPDGEPFVVERRLDRTDRQYRQRLAGEARGPDVYASAGAGSPPIRGFDPVALGERTVDDGRTVRASPDYLLYTTGYAWDGEGGLQPPAPVDGWRVADRSDERLVLELTGARPTFEAVQGVSPDRITNVSVARIRAVVDRENRTLERIEVRFAATVTAGETTDRIERRVDHAFAVGIDVDRPAALGPPRPGELLWKLLVY